MDPVEERAARILSAVPEWLWDGETLPVPIEDIADSVFGLLVRDVEDMSAAPGAPPLAAGQSLSGLLLAARGEIWVNAEEARTVAAAPALHDRPRARALGDAPRSPAHAVLPARRRSKRTSRTPSPDIEEEASAFAAALLMPQWLFVREYAELGDNLDAMCKRFRTSGVAMNRRMATLFRASE